MSSPDLRNAIERARERRAARIEREREFVRQFKADVLTRPWTLRGAPIELDPLSACADTLGRIRAALTQAQNGGAR